MTKWWALSEQKKSMNPWGLKVPEKFVLETQSWSLRNGRNKVYVSLLSNINDKSFHLPLNIVYNR